MIGHLMVVMLSFTLWHCVLVFTKSLHVCSFDPVTHVIYAFGFAFKTRRDKVVSELC
jgi:hypothetical protein